LRLLNQIGGDAEGGKDSKQGGNEKNTTQLVDQVQQKGKAKLSVYRRKKRARVGDEDLLQKRKKGVGGEQGLTENRRGVSAMPLD